MEISLWAVVFLRQTLEVQLEEDTDDHIRK